MPAAAATSEVLVEQPMPVVAANGQTLSGSLFTIDENVKKATPHWALFAADEHGKRNALNDLRMTQIPMREVVPKGSMNLRFTQIETFISTGPAI